MIHDNSMLSDKPVELSRVGSQKFYLTCQVWFVMAHTEAHTMAHTEESLNNVNDLVNYRVQWTDSMVKMLLAEMNKHVESVTHPINKQLWKNIATSINMYNYDVTAEQCNIKWTSMKKKYKMLKDAKNQTGAAKQTWEYFDIMNDMLKQKPEIEPLSIASSTRGFQINQNALNTCTSVCDDRNLSDNENAENELYSGPSNILNNRVLRATKSKHLSGLQKWWNKKNDIM